MVWIWIMTARLCPYCASRIRILLEENLSHQTLGGTVFRILHLPLPTNVSQMMAVKITAINVTGFNKNNTMGVGLSSAMTIFVAHWLTNRSNRFSRLFNLSAKSSSVGLSEGVYQLRLSFDRERLWLLPGRIVEDDEVDDVRDRVGVVVPLDERRLRSVGVRIRVVVVVIVFWRLWRIRGPRVRSTGVVWPVRRRDTVFI